MPAAPAPRPAGASSIGDEATWLAALRTELERAKGEFSAEQARWETEAGPGRAESAAPGRPEGLERWRGLIASAVAEANAVVEIESVAPPEEAPALVPAPMPAPSPVPDEVMATAPLPVAGVLPPVAANDPPTPPTPPVSDWYFAEGGRTLGPYPEGELRARLRDGRLRGETPVWCAEQGEWRPAEASVLASAPEPAALPLGARARRFCHGCGTPVAVGDRFCSNCGAPLRAP